MSNINRREFIKKTTKVGLTASILQNTDISFSKTKSEISIVKNNSPEQLVRKAIDQLGGMERFVKKGQTVFLKPNMSWDRLPEQAANTNPEAVAQVVKMCLQAGAKKVRIVDKTCNAARRCYKQSKIEDMASAAGAEVRYIVDSRFTSVDIPQGELLKRWSFYKDVLEFDVFINMPIAKHHGVSGVTLGMKNIMGVIGERRGDIHKDFDIKIVDLNTVISPALTIIDAYRVLVRNGPSGGNLDDVEERKTVIAGTDRVAVDAYALTLFNQNPVNIKYLVHAYNRGLGEIDLSKIIVHEFNFS